VVVLPPVRFKLFKELSGSKHSNAVPWVQHQQILIPRHNDRGLGSECQLQLTVVLGISAVLDLLGWINPKRSGRQQLEGLATSVLGQDPHELLSRQNLGDFAEDRL
jgi:hypothetical protein